MDIKEGTCWYEHWVLYVSDESLGSTPEPSSTGSRTTGSNKCTQKVHLVSIDR